MTSPRPVQRVATIDIGTNTVLLLVAERGADGSLRPLAERATITRLGEGVDRTRELNPAAIARTTTCLDDYARVIRDHAVDRIAVVGTSAMRDARGGQRIADHVKQAIGVDARILSGDEEARVTFAGALSGLSQPCKPITVFDIGGGSTEIVRGRADINAIEFATSIDIGSVRLTERVAPSDPLTPANHAALERGAKESFANLSAATACDEPVGIAGTVTTLAAVALGLNTYDGSLVHGHRMSLVELRNVVSRLANLELAARIRVPGLEAKRADVIVAGGIICLSLLEKLGASGLRVSDRGVRWGLAESLMRSDT